MADIAAWSWPEVVGRNQRHVPIFHQLEQVRLHAPAGDIAPAAFAPGRQLVRLVEVDDAVLGRLHVVARSAIQVAHEVVHVPADVAGLAELRRVRLHEGHADHLGCGTDQVRLAHAGGPEQEHVLLLVERSRQAFHRHADMLEMVAQRHAEDLLRLALADDETVEVLRDLVGLEVEAELRRRGRRRFGHAGLGCGIELGRPVFLEPLWNAGRDGTEGLWMAGRDFNHRQRVFAGNPKVKNCLRKSPP